MQIKSKTRVALATLALAAGSVIVTAAQAPEMKPVVLSIAPGPFQGTFESLTNYHCPEWFRDAKFGIFVHWGVMSVPEQSCWYARQMYMEKGSYGGDSVWRAHRERYGHPSVFGFKDLVPLWRAERFDPDELVRQFRDSGARYVVAMAVHP